MSNQNLIVCRDFNFSDIQIKPIEASTLTYISFKFDSLANDENIISNLFIDDAKLDITFAKQEELKTIIEDDIIFPERIFGHKDESLFPGLDKLREEYPDLSFSDLLSLYKDSEI
jgi:hypothetical protein